MGRSAGSKVILKQKLAGSIYPVLGRVIMARQVHYTWTNSVYIYVVLTTEHGLPIPCSFAAPRNMSLRFLLGCFLLVGEIYVGGYPFFGTRDGRKVREKKTRSTATATRT